ncbi:MAG: hypothetical protein R3E32_08275 [Chitinophagales bacterium]
MLLSYAFGIACTYLVSQRSKRTFSILVPLELWTLQYAPATIIFGTQSIHKASHSLQILLFCDALGRMVLVNCLYLKVGK